MAERMGGKECMAILRKVGISRDEFSKMMGIKRSTMRTCVHGDRISYKMERKLRELNGEKVVEEEIAEVDAMIKEAKKPKVVVKEEAGVARMAKVYAIPQNKFLRLIEFRDGTHGKIRCKPGKYYIGDEVRVRGEDRGLWEIV